MPYKVRKGKGRKPYKIVASNGRTVGSSATKAKAQKSAAIRNKK